MSYMSCPKCGQTMHESDYVHRGCSYCRERRHKTSRNKIVVEVVNTVGDKVDEYVITLSDEQVKKCLEVGFDTILQTYLDKL